MIVGIVLAAGRSRRMGRPKSLLEIDGRTLLARAIEALRSGGCDEVVVVTGPPSDEHAERAAELAGRGGARVVVNPDSQSQQIDSLRAALRTTRTAEAVVVLPVDVPVEGPATTAALIRAYRRSGAPIVVAVFRGERGHPVLFAAGAVGDLMVDPLPEGARTVIHARETDVVEVAVDEGSAVLDIDTPGDYRAALERS